MIKRLIISMVALFCISATWAQIERSAEFKEKYKLSEVVVFSRHNIRAPLVAPGGFISKVTPHTWYDFGVNAGELTMKGGILETTNGQFFQQWVAKEGLFPENAEPTDEELYVMSNSFQRTISTARHFSAAFMPMKTITVNHVAQVGTMEKTLSMNLEDDITEEQWTQIKAEYDSIYPAARIREASESLQPAYDLLTEILDLKNSEAYKDGTFKGFTDHDSKIDYPMGKEPAMTASINDAGKVVDALVLQYYQEQDPEKEAFGKHLTQQQWQTLSKVIHVRDAIRFSSPFVQRYVSKHQRERLAEELQNENRKFFFMCGHDTNILNILTSLKTKEYETTDAVEIGTPIGSKIVFEKWTDASGNAFVAVNHVYQTVDELRNNTLLNLSTRPNIIPLHFEGLETNEDGLYTLSQMICRLKLEDLPTDVTNIKAENTSSSNAKYSLSGMSVDDSHKGIVITDGKKIISK